MTNEMLCETNIKRSQLKRKLLDMGLEKNWIEGSVVPNSIKDNYLLDLKKNIETIKSQLNDITKPEQKKIAVKNIEYRGYNHKELKRNYY